MLGLPLDAVLAYCREKGVEAKVIRTDDPRDPRTAGTPRVTRIRGEELTVSLFRDGMPGENSEG